MTISRLSLFLGAALLAGGGPPHSPPRQPPPDSLLKAPAPKSPAEWAWAFAKVRVGMTGVQVRDLLGTPTRVSRQAVYQRVVEQWRYASPEPIVVDFDCLKGQESHVSALWLDGRAQSR